ncbi:pimeloyl-ACP methyl ester carboxylesterase [Micromonospora luteifusca]|uniref:Pimeloyl-ACP methyl ester carboxylesterase n=1 Tax=Micromonospora luteifusca TaxID=709860 RepID=A0ABS2LTI2_9ACTN|nr:prolyl oligopeptidase family serine peptidase [Micromonospora luteifusca]MBM7491492.1 pimeloyl-ACP methyl ester carboxylesterase [Micromonospora luteifusca]
MFRRALLTITAALAAVLLPALPAGAVRATQAQDLTTTDLTVTTGDGQHLAATLYAPRQNVGRLPGLVLIAGSGAAPREELVPEAAAFARQGMAVLAYDKRYTGYTKTHRDYSQLADDAVRAYEVLRDRPEVDPTQVGFWGISEGGWVSPMAAGRAGAAFLVAASAPGLAPLRTQNWNMRNKVARAGVTGSLMTTLADRAHRLSADAGLFAEPYYDPRPALRLLHQPVLAVYGGADEQVPAAESMGVLRQSVPGPLTVRVLPGAGHALHVRDTAGGYTEALVPGYADLVGTWVRAVAAGHPPTPTADPMPAQPTRSTALQASAWWEGWPMQAAALIALLLAFATYPVIGGVRRLQRRPGTAHRPAAVLSTAGLLSVIGFAGYLLVVESSADSRGITVGPIVGGRPAIWLALQGAALVAVIAAAMTVPAWRRDRVRLGVLIAGAVVYLPWALYWGLLLP